MHLLLRCFSCKGFSNQQSTKASRWECKRCGSTQSVQRIFFSSESSREVREELSRIAVQMAAADAASASAAAASALALEREAEEARVDEAGTAIAEPAAPSRLETLQRRAAALSDHSSVNTLARVEGTAPAAGEIVGAVSVGGGNNTAAQRATDTAQGGGFIVDVWANFL